MALLNVTDISLTIHTSSGIIDVLKNVSFSIQPGESVGLIGESGSGKSIMALAIMGLLPKAAQISGSIHFQGQDLVTLDEARLTRLRGDRIAIIFQEAMSALNPVQTIGNQVAEAIWLHQGLSKRAARNRAGELLNRVGLPTSEFSFNRYPHELSGGERQRVGIAIALSCGPDLLIADEPTTALDVTTQAQILDLITNIAAEENIALFFISHDLGVIAEMTDNMLVMYAGMIMERGPTADVFKKMAHPYARALFRAMPSTAMPGTPLHTIPGKIRSPTMSNIGCPFAERCEMMSQHCTQASPPTHIIHETHHVTCFHPHMGNSP